MPAKKTPHMVSIFAKTAGRPGTKRKVATPRPVGRPPAGRTGTKRKVATPRPVGRPPAGRTGTKRKVATPRPVGRPPAGRTGTKRKVATPRPVGRPPAGRPGTKKISVDKALARRISDMRRAKTRFLNILSKLPRKFNLQNRTGVNEFVSKHFSDQFDVVVEEWAALAKKYPKYFDKNKLEGDLSSLENFANSIGNAEYNKKKPEVRKTFSNIFDKMIDDEQLKIIKLGARVKLN